MAMVFKLSKAGIPVEEATSDQLIMNSGQECLKIEERILGSLELPYTEFDFGGDPIQKISVYNDHPHSLGFFPVVKGFQYDTINYYFNEIPYSYVHRYSDSGPFVGYGYDLYPQIYKDKIRVFLSVECIYLGFLSPVNINYLLYIFANKLE